METFSPKGKIQGPILPMHALEMPISSSAKILYALLCNYAGERDHCWPSHAVLAAKVGCSVSSIKNYLNELQREKLICIQFERYRSSTYYMLRPSCPRSGRVQTQEPNSGYPQANSGYRNNLRNNKNKITPPFPPRTRSFQTPPATKQHNRGGGNFLVANSIFEKLWSAYPRKEAKELARSAWHHLWRQGLLPALDVLMTALDKFKTSAMWLKEHGRFVPQMVNWLKGQRWKDEVSKDGAAFAPGVSVLAPEEKAKIEEYNQWKKTFLERERQRDAKYREETALLRPSFDAFLSRFEDGEKMRGMAWGMWCLHQRKGKAPLAAHVTDDAAIGGVIAFLRNFRFQDVATC